MTAGVEQDNIARVGFAQTFDHRVKIEVVGFGAEPGIGFERETGGGEDFVFICLIPSGVAEI